MTDNSSYRFHFRKENYTGAVQVSIHLQGAGAYCDGSIAASRTAACFGSLTSRGMPLMPGLQHLGGKHTRAAAQRPSERVSIDA